MKKFDNVNSGFLECGDCGSPMFAMSRTDLREAYRCGEYHRRGLKACTSHHIRADKLDLWEKLCFGMLDLAKRKGWNCT